MNATSTNANETISEKIITIIIPQNFSKSLSSKLFEEGITICSFNCLPCGPFFKKMLAGVNFTKGTENNYSLKVKGSAPKEIIIDFAKQENIEIIEKN